MLVGAPLVEAQQDSSIGIEDLREVVMGRKASRLPEQRLIPFETTRHVAYPYDRPRALHRVPLCGLILVCADLDTTGHPRTCRTALCRVPRSYVFLQRCVFCPLRVKTYLSQQVYRWLKLQTYTVTGGWWPSRAFPFDPLARDFLLGC